MKTIFFPIEKSKTKDILFDLFAVAFITLTPALSHVSALPVYFLEPMRIVALLALVHTSKRNAYLLTIALPLFSFLISSHPSFVKAALISSELALNVFLFYLLSQKISNYFVAALFSIVISKVYYYLLKFSLLQAGLLSGELASSPIWLQAVLSLVFAGYIGWFFKKRIQL
ncbi:MAG: hypothetical protein FD143_1099 [Ignavibacteria bacterium]|nr:MAG: hypothetical protein FD143_1099 [Ignavibacteria bacterium]KAF0161030.1 MAG: hypothetical protein FD188_1251 [Ignavibacteria bacterium]